MSKSSKSKKLTENSKKLDTPENTAPDWSRKCENCGATPVVPITGMCGPCTFGEAETANGNW